MRQRVKASSLGLATGLGNSSANRRRFILYLKFHHRLDLPCNRHTRLRRRRSWSPGTVSDSEASIFRSQIDRRRVGIHARARPWPKCLLGEWLEGMSWCLERISAITPLGAKDVRGAGSLVFSGIDLGSLRQPRRPELSRVHGSCALPSSMPRVSRCVASP